MFGRDILQQRIFANNVNKYGEVATDFTVSVYERQKTSALKSEWVKVRDSVSLEDPSIFLRLAPYIDLLYDVKFNKDLTCLSVYTAYKANTKNGEILPHPFEPGFLSHFHKDTKFLYVNKSAEGIISKEILDYKAVSIHLAEALKVSTYTNKKFVVPSLVCCYVDWYVVAGHYVVLEVSYVRS